MENENMNTSSEQPCIIHDVSESLLRETIYLLSIKQPDNCPNWIEGVGDCNKPECEFCRIQRCINELESNIWKTI